MINQDQGENQISKQYFQKCQELAQISKPFSLDEAQQEKNRRDFQSQFDLIRALTQTKKHRSRLRINSVVQNKKNRYPQQSIYQHSRVKLSSKYQQEEDYINANVIPISQSKKIIITQGPLQSTQQDFQLMLQRQEISCVIMVCNFVQNKKSRCSDYLSNRQKKMIQEKEGYIAVNQVQLKENEQNRIWNYLHVHYSQWPDKQLPAHPFHLSQLYQITRKHKNICIQCSAGLGRSGVMACVLLLQQKIDKGEKISVFETVRRVREYRFGAVQNNLQYQFLYQYICWQAANRQ